MNLNIIYNMLKTETTTTRFCFKDLSVKFKANVVSSNIYRGILEV